jgi:hypothetical protein
LRPLTRCSSPRQESLSRLITSFGWLSPSLGSCAAQRCRRPSLSRSSPLVRTAPSGGGDRWAARNRGSGTGRRKTCGPHPDDVGQLSWARANEQCWVLIKRIFQTALNLNQPSGGLPTLKNFKIKYGFVYNWIRDNFTDRNFLRFDT